RVLSYPQLISFFFSSRRRHTRWPRDWSSDVCSSDLRSTPKQNPYSLAKRTSITLFSKSVFIPTQRTIHQPKRASRLKLVTQPTRLYRTAHSPKPENSL